MSNVQSREPAAVAATVVAAVKAVLGALVVLGAVSLTDSQIAYLVVAVEAVLAVPVVLFVRSKTVTKAGLEALADAEEA